MAVDVIIDPSSGQIYWNDQVGVGTQTIAISGNATNAINIVGYSNFFSPGGGGLGTNILATFNDSASSTFVPGTNGYDLGSSALRWNLSATAGNFTGVISTSSSTASTSTSTGALTVAGGMGVVGDVFVSSASGSKLSVMQSAGDEGGEIFLNKAVTNTSITTGVTIDVYQNRLRFFETGGTNRGAYIDITACSTAVGTNLLSSGSGSGISNLNGLTATTQTFATGTSGSDFNISSSSSTHTFNIPYAGAASTGLITTQAQTIAGAKTFSGQTSITDSTATTSTTTGALIITGGVGIAGSIWSGQHIVTNTTTSSSTSTGAMLVFGGLGVSGQINAASLQTSGNAVISGNLQFNGVGTFGNATTDTISSLARYASDLLPSADNTYDLGNNTLGWRNFRVSGVGTIATLQVTSVTSGLWAGTAITLAYGGTNNNISGIGHSFRVAVYDSAGTAITNITSAGTANSILFQVSPSTIPNWAGQSQLVVGGASTAANIQGGALGNIHYQSAANTTAFVTNAAGSGASLLSQTGNAVPVFIGQSQITAGGASTAANIQGGATGNIHYQSAANTTAFVTNAAGSGASVLSQTGNAVPVFVGQSQLFVGSATTSAQVVTDATTATRFLVGTVLNTASSGGTVLSTGSGITIGNNLLTTGSLAVTNSTGSATTSSGALVVVGGVGIGGTLNVGSSNLSYSAPNLLAGFASSINSYNQVVIQNLSTGTSASADFILNNNLSTDTTYYGSFGMNSSTFTGAGSLNLPNAVYVTSTTGDLVLGSTTANILRFVYNSGASDSMQITGTAVSVIYNTGSSSTSTGALTVLGGVGIGGSLWTATTNFSSISGVGHSNSVITSGVWSGTAISAVNGGTGQVSYAIGDILYASSTTALAKLSAGTAGSVLASGGAGAAPFWKADATGAGGAPGGSNYQIQYNNASSFGGASRLLYNALSAEEFLITSPYQTTVNASLNIGFGTTSFDGVTLGKFAGSANGTVFAINQASNFTGNFEDFQLNGSSKYTVGFDGKITIVGAFSFPTTAGTAGSVLTSNGTGNQLYWSAPGTGSGGSGTVSSGTGGSVAFYTTSGSGTTVGGAPGFTYTTAGTASTVNIFGGGTAGTILFTVQAYSASSVRVGIGTNLPQYELEINGEISATNKSFVIDHPTKPGKKLRYGSLEGPENGVYVRGELKDSNVIETPDHWKGLVHSDSFTVSLTPIGRFSHLYVEKIEDYKVFIADAYMNPIHCYYTVWAERKDIPKLITEY